LLIFSRIEDLEINRNIVPKNAIITHLFNSKFSTGGKIRKNNPVPMNIHPTRLNKYERLVKPISLCLFFKSNMEKVKITTKPKIGTLLKNIERI